jgi:hypothetical protein
MDRRAEADEVRAILTAYKTVKDASWPSLHPNMAWRAAHWPATPAPDLRAELDGYLKEASQPDCAVRVFWKTGAELTFAGCNQHFVRDAGMASAADLIGLSDFSSGIPWRAQAGKYRQDDQEVVTSGSAKLDILERQSSASGVVWVLVGKAPIRGNGQVTGVLGMYELIENERATKLYIERARQSTAAPR